MLRREGENQSGYASFVNTWRLYLDMYAARVLKWDTPYADETLFGTK